ncbi:MAG: hypothetical protein ACRBK7_03995 [Acidimicrobiales bacterium]
MDRQSPNASHQGEIGHVVMPAHIIWGEGEAMKQPTTYEIVVRGRATERLLRSIIDDFVVDYPESGRTRLTGAIRDPSHLHGVVAHLTSVAAEIISITPTDPAPQSNKQPNN